MTEPTYEELLRHNSELLLQIERLCEYGTRCAEELICMINTHNEYNINDNSYKYDHQTPVELLEIIRKGCIIEETKLIPPPPESPKLRMVNEDGDCWFTKRFTRGE